MYESDNTKNEDPFLGCLTLVLLAIVFAIISVRFIDDNILRSSLYGCVLAWVVYKVYRLIKCLYGQTKY